MDLRDRQLVKRTWIPSLSVLGLWALCLALLSREYAIDSLLDVPGMIAVFVPLIAATFMTRGRVIADWPLIWLAAGVPLGLFASVAGFIFHLGLHGLSGDYAEIYPLVGWGLTTVLYGGIASAIGYFCSEARDRTTSPPILSAIQATLLTLLLWALVLLMFFSNLSLVWNPIALAILVSCIGTACLLNPRNKLRSAAEATIFASLLLLVLGIIYFYFADGQDIAPLMLANVGLAYGILAYLTLYFVSLGSGVAFISTSNANWHWLELCAFLIFMLYAPETIREIQMGNSEGANQMLGE